MPGMEGNKQINQSKQTHHNCETKEQQEEASDNETRCGERWGAGMRLTVRATGAAAPFYPMAMVPDTPLSAHREVAPMQRGANIHAHRLQTNPRMP